MPVDMRPAYKVSMQWVDSSTVLLPSLCEHDFSPEDEFDTLCYQTPLMYVRMVEHEDSAGQRVTEWLPSSGEKVRFRRPRRRRRSGTTGAFEPHSQAVAVDGVGVPTEVTPTPYRDTP
jgi:hypothetical protein